MAVLIDHASSARGFHLVTGSVAVEAFFMISGFYMALVLNEKYIKENSSYSLFISQRLLRLYPIYWVVLGLTVAISAVLLGSKGYPLKLEAYLQASHLTPVTWLVLGWSNLVIIGQDALMFLGLDKASGQLYWTADFHATASPQVWQFLFVHQAWSLSIEIAFYLMAPFLMRRHTGVLLLLTILGIGLRIYIYHIGLRNDPWSYRFLPCELAFFFTGGLAYRAYAQLKRRAIPRAVLWLALTTVVGFIMSYSFLPPTYLVQILFYVCFAVALPFNFLLTKKSSWDYKIGELSYPFYISHVLVLLLFWYLSPELHSMREKMVFALALLTTNILFSMLLVRFVAEPVERLRQRRIKKSAAILTVPAVWNEA
ncbi:acyltransferase [Hymenobacter sp. RP-2-7]|uniref:Acyltransferase n=2 Tax=Hymenobacter polaris TaxID=2682546 RepID=A0A7Y0FLR6_9BACT|nr:acyltransferase [Hymenobacter polaris]